ncbi:MAG TPA: M48 family peptidase [Chromatiales bacterium]|nr:M48 family peptidase [Chromatiales bacterium]
MIVQRILHAILAVMMIGVVAGGCATVPISGRSQFNLVSDEQANALGAEAYRNVESESRLIKSGAQYDQVLRVGKRIAVAANEPGFQWEFCLIDEPKTINAFCLPGGKIAVYSGILPITKDDAGLATVLAHESAHAIARHGSERMTDQLAIQLGGLGLQQLLQEKSPAMQQVAMAAFGVGTTVGVVLPFSRAQESEADHMGLVIMARAGYDPREAPLFWRRMMGDSDGAGVPSFLSDHPTDEDRVQNLETWMPEALASYHP